MISKHPSPEEIADTFRKLTEDTASPDDVNADAAVCIAHLMALNEDKFRTIQAYCKMADEDKAKIKALERDMLEVLQNIISAWDRDVPDESLAQEMDAARAAIAKATGGEAMRRRVLFLTESEIGCLRAAIRTADEEDCGVSVHEMYEKLLTKVNNAPTINSSNLLKAAEEAEASIRMFEAEWEELTDGKQGPFPCHKAGAKLRKAIDSAKGKP